MDLEVILSQSNLAATRLERHGDPSTWGWGVRLAADFSYFNPDIYYETIVKHLCRSASSWLEIGGGSSIFPSNSFLAKQLSAQCPYLVCLDPSDNLKHNPYAHEKFEGFLEDYKPSRRFALATARMVIEHVANPEEFTQAAANLLEPGGYLVFLTVAKWAPLTVISKFTPFWVHVVAKRFIWKTKDEDTFPTVYKMNSRADLSRLTAAAGLTEVAFLKLDDCRTLSRWKLTLHLELACRKLLRSLGLGYPEHCLLGIYRKP